MSLFRHLRLWGSIARAAALMAWHSDRRKSVAAKPLRLLPFIIRRERLRTRKMAELGVPVPSVCMFSVTWTCNLRCVGCYAAGYRSGGELGVETVGRVLREAIDLGSYLFVIVGGEPLMVDGIIDLLAGTRDGLFFLFTNGTLLNEAHVEKLVRAPNVVPVVSFEGDRGEMIFRRGEKACEGALRSMAMLRDAGVFYGVAAMVTKRNVRIVTARSWFDEVWAQGARIAILLDYVAMDANADASLLLTREDRELKSRELERRFREARPIVVNFPPDEYRNGECRSAGRGFIHVNADGYVEPCPFSHFASENVRDKALADILKSPFMCRLRDESGGWENPERTCLLAANRDRVEEIAAETGAFFTEAQPREARR